MSRMKTNEASLFFIVSVILTSFILFFILVQSQTLAFSDPIVKKDLMIIFFILFILIYAATVSSFSKAFLIFYPILFELDRTLIQITDFLPLPQVLKATSINVIDVIIFTLFVVLFDIKEIFRLFRFRPIFYYNLFLITGLITIFWAFNRNAAIAYVPTIILLPMSYYVFFQFFKSSERNILYITIGLFFSAALSIIFVWPSYFGIEWFTFLLNRDSSKTGSTQTTVRAGGILARAGMAILLAGLIPYLYNFGVFYFRKYRKYIHMIGVFLVLTLVLTLNRMHFAATCLAIGLILWFAIRERVVKGYIGAIIVGGFTFLGVVVYVISLNGNDYMDTVDRSTWNGRIEQFNTAYENFKYSAGLGIGMNNFLISPISVNLLSGNNGAFDDGNTIHDDYLRALCEYGGAGFLFFILFYTSLFKIRGKTDVAHPLVRGAKLNIMSLAIIGLTAPTLNHNSAAIIIGIYLAIIKYYSEKRDSTLLPDLISKY